MNNFLFGVGRTYSVRHLIGETFPIRCASILLVIHALTAFEMGSFIISDSSHMSLPSYFSVKQFTLSVAKSFGSKLIDSSIQLNRWFIAHWRVKRWYGRSTKPINLEPRFLAARSIWPKRKNNVKTDNRHYTIGELPTILTMRRRQELIDFQHDLLVFRIVWNL